MISTRQRPAVKSVDYGISAPYLTHFISVDATADDFAADEDRKVEITLYPAHVGRFIRGEGAVIITADQAVVAGAWFSDIVEDKAYVTWRGEIRRSRPPSDG
jgi:hypothetical protein